jgi:hypothetical protein
MITIRIHELRLYNSSSPYVDPFKDQMRSQSLELMAFRPSTGPIPDASKDHGTICSRKTDLSTLLGNRAYTRHAAGYGTKASASKHFKATRKE